MDPSGPAGRIIRRVAGEIGIMFDPPRVVGKKDGGLMEAIRKVDAEKGMMDGGEIDMSRGQAGYNFKGVF